MTEAHDTPVRGAGVPGGRSSNSGDHSQIRPPRRLTQTVSFKQETHGPPLATLQGAGTAPSHTLCPPESSGYTHTSFPMESQAGRRPSFVLPISRLFATRKMQNTRDVVYWP